MPNLSSSDVAGIANSLKPNVDPNSIVSSISSTIKDPLGGSLVKIIGNINSLSTSISDKINKLTDDIIQSANNNGRVQLVDNKLIITVKPEEKAKADTAAIHIQGNIDNITKSINTANLLINSLSILGTTVKTLTLAMDVQEALLTINPVSKATMTVLKQGLKILFYKDVLKEYSGILTSTIASNKLIINSLSNKFHDLKVQIVVSDANDSGSIITKDEANSMIVDANLNGELSNTESYNSQNGNTYLLKVEKYGSRELIARAYDSFSGMIITETAPSFISTSAQLLSEIKQILDLTK